MSRPATVLSIFLTPILGLALAAALVSPLFWLKSMEAGSHRMIKVLAFEAVFGYITILFSLWAFNRVIPSFMAMKAEKDAIPFEDKEEALKEEDEYEYVEVEEEVVEEEVSVGEESITTETTLAEPEATPSKEGELPTGPEPEPLPMAAQAAESAPTPADEASPQDPLAQDPPIVQEASEVTEFARIPHLPYRAPTPRQAPETPKPRRKVARASSSNFPGADQAD